MKSVYSVVNSFSGQALKEVKVSHYIKSKIVPLWSEIFGKLWMRKWPKRERIFR